MHDIIMYDITVHVCPSHNNYDRPQSLGQVRGIQAVGLEEFVQTMSALHRHNLRMASTACYSVTGAERTGRNG